MARVYTKSSMQNMLLKVVSCIVNIKTLNHSRKVFLECLKHLFVPGNVPNFQSGEEQLASFMAEMVDSIDFTIVHNSRKQSMKHREDNIVASDVLDDVVGSTNLAFIIPGWLDRNADIHDMYEI